MFNLHTCICFRYVFICLLMVHKKAEACCIIDTSNNDYLYVGWLISKVSYWVALLGLTLNSDRYRATLRSLKQCIHRIRLKETCFFSITTTQGHIAVHKLRTPWQAWNSQWFHTLLTAQIWHCQTRGCSQNWWRRLKVSIFHRMPKLRHLCANGSAANQKLSSWMGWTNG